MSGSRLIVAAMLAAIPAGAWAGQPASFVDLGDLPGGRGLSVATAVSADGSVVVGYSDSAFGQQAFRWTLAGGMAGLGDLPDGTFLSTARGVSADGAVVVGDSAAADGQYAFRWQLGDVALTPLGDLPGGDVLSVASCVSGNAAVIAGYSSSTASSLLGHEAFRQSGAAPLEALGDLPGSLFHSAATAISSDGSTIVGFGTSAASGASGSEAFRWTAAGGLQGLGDLAGGSFNSRALGVSTDGFVIVGVGTSINGTFAFRWTDPSAGGTGMMSLGDLAGGAADSQANGLSTDGAIVVGRATTAAGPRAFVWTQPDGMRQLSTVLAVDLNLSLAGWTLEEATAISADGMTIVGYGLAPDGQYRAWRAFLGFALYPPGDGDINNDGFINLVDHAALPGCLTGPGPTSLTPECATFDFEPDFDVDLADVAEIFAAFSPIEFTVAIIGCPTSDVILGATIALSASTMGGSGEPTFEWNLSSGVGTFSDPFGAATTFTPMSTGLMAVTVTAIAAGESDSDTCLVGVDPPPVISFTLDTDDLTGTPGDDKFDAPLIFNAPSGMQLASLQTGDRANGGEGADRLDAAMNGLSVTPTELTGIETQNYTLFAPTTLNAGNVSGVDEINSVSSVATLTVLGLQELTDFGLVNVSDGMSGIAATFALVTTTSGASDVLSLALAGSNAGTVNITTASTNGFETLQVKSQGSSANTLQNLTQTTGTTLATANITGTQDVRLRVMPNSIRTYNATGLSGDLTLGGGDGGLTPFATFATNDLLAITGGSGDDMFIFANTLNDADAQGAGGGINGGMGTDTVQATLGANLAAVAPFVSIENVILNATGNFQINLTGVAGISNVITQGGNSEAINTLTLLNIGGTPLPTITYRGDGQPLPQFYDAVIIASAGTGGAADSMTLSIDNRGFALNAIGTTNVHTLGMVTVPNVENLTFNVTDGPAMIQTGITASTLTSFTASGSSHVNLGTVQTGVNNTITSFNLAGVMGTATAIITNGSNGISITGAGGNDALTVIGNAILTSSVATLGSGDDILIYADADDNAPGTNPSADVINTGIGSDIITPGEGNDIVTPGNGNDTIVYTSNFAAAPVNNDGADQISGFAVGDRLRFDAAPPALTTMAFNTAIAQMTNINNDGANTVVVVDIDTDAGDTVGLFITLTGVTLTSANFMIVGNDIVRMN